MERLFWKCVIHLSSACSFSFSRLLICSSICHRFPWSCTSGLWESKEARRSLPVPATSCPLSRSSSRVRFFSWDNSWNESDVCYGPYQGTSYSVILLISLHLTLLYENIRYGTVFCRAALKLIWLHFIIDEFCIINTVTEHWIGSKWITTLYCRVAYSYIEVIS